MKKSVLVWTAALLTVGTIGLGTFPLAAQVAPPPIASEILTPRSVFPDDVEWAGVAVTAVLDSVIAAAGEAETLVDEALSGDGKA
jgi:hypothetical protein